MVNDSIILVTGASRGLGRGIARAFGSKGATVYVTGRHADELGPVVGEIDAAGGKGVAVVCDHKADDQIAALFAQIAKEAGRLDILVNNAAAVYPDASPMMVAAKRGLIASISFYGSVSYFHGAAYGAAKAGTDKMMRDMAVDLAPHNVAAVAIWPGFILTDAVKAIPLEFLPEELRANLPNWETPEFTGLAIYALARDPDLMSLSGQALIGAELGERYKIVDLDGKQPISYRSTMGAPANS